METYESHESVYSSFLDAQIKRTNYSFQYVPAILTGNYTNYQAHEFPSFCHAR